MSGEPARVTLQLDPFSEADHAGLPANEMVSLKIGDIDSTRMMIRIAWYRTGRIRRGAWQSR